ncbi:hypothetical protein ACFVW1_51890 [Streptomyces olivochromogenes]|uniref:hypothetical protein n=1 Tax=Streptomyces olivochromogenes TaxID=1963 RepID=UPI0036DE9C08
MRLYYHADDPEPGIGDHGERHLVQLWPAPHTPPVHPDIAEADRQARADYAAGMAMPVEDYSTTYTDTYHGEQDGQRWWLAAPGSARRAVTRVAKRLAAASMSFGGRVR